MKLDLTQCEQVCVDCIKQYKKKHDLKPGQKFEIPCKGILKKEVFLSAVSHLSQQEQESALMMIDPVVWAANTLDWHCLDPEGQVWKSKNPVEYFEWIGDNPGISIFGKSRYHRPFQNLMLKCSSRRKVARIGRQCLVGNTKVLMSNGQRKNISNIQIGDKVKSIETNGLNIEDCLVVDSFYSGVRQTYFVKTKLGKYLQCTDDHQILVWKRKNNIYAMEPIWLSIKDGLSIGDRIFISNLTWDTIASIEESTDEDVYDITVAKNHNFFANDIVVKNCGKTEVLAIKALFHLFTKPGVAADEGYKVVIVTPYQSQSDLIFNRITQLIKESPIVYSSIKRAVKSPNYMLELHNNSTMRCFTAGSKSGGNADAVRGSTANLLIIDEADYLADGDYNSIMSVVANQPKATVWLSSTPSGKRERFYSTCHDKRFKEFYFPSMANPLWSSESEADFRSRLTEIGYKHEVLAEFGEQEEGVFQAGFVNAAKASYKYNDVKRNDSWIYSIGVDWNDVRVGTSIVITGFNPIANKLMVCGRANVSREGWTQLAAIEKIRDLNRIWKPKYIYIDAGYGSVQFELLKEYGFKSLSDPTKGRNHPDSNLRNVKKYDFGGKVDIRDPWSKQIISKEAKPYLVETTVRRFESGGLVFSEYDEALTQQLLGYIIKRVTQSGRPVYEAANEKAGDHDLDALMLSIVAFDLEMSVFGKPTFTSNIAFTGQFGEKLSSNEFEILQNSNQKNISSNTKPSNIRTEVFDQPKSILGNNSLPANTNNTVPVKLWSWPGFLRDEPPPTQRSKNLRPGKPKKRSF